MPKHFMAPASQMLVFAACPLLIILNLFWIILNLGVSVGQNTQCKRVTLGSGYFWEHLLLFSKLLQTNQLINGENKFDP